MLPAARLLVRIRPDGSAHARLQLNRASGWHICGIFDLEPDEWIRLAQFAAQHDIGIEYERDGAA